jgi:polyphosphate kinase 2
VNQVQNPENISVDGETISLQDFITQHKDLVEENASLRKSNKKAIRRYQREEELKPFQAELLQVQRYLEEKQRRMIILFEGRDAAGKGGTIRRVTRYMNEKHYRIVALGKPTEEQKTQWYYQKYVSQFPRAGEFVLFDRSWYNRAMVERVFSFCTEKEYYDFMRGVVGFERDLVRQDTILVKLYFSVTKDEQARRFERRKTDPLRQWKLSEVDVQAQDRWDDFTNVKYEMLKRTHTIDSPWTVVRSNDKHLARLNAIKVILNAVPYERLDASLDFALDENVIVSGSRELEKMDVERVRGGASPQRLVMVPSRVVKRNAKRAASLSSQTGALIAPWRSRYW